MDCIGMVRVDLQGLAIEALGFNELPGPVLRKGLIDEGLRDGRCRQLSSRAGYGRSSTAHQWVG